MRTLRFLLILALVTGLLNGRPVLAMPQSAQDIFMGSGTTGRFALSWKLITPDSETVVVNSLPQTRGLDYTLDPDAGTITFTRPLPAQSAAEVRYSYDPGHAVRVSSGLAIPLSLALASSQSGSLALSALYQQPGQAASQNKPGTFSVGLGGDWHGAHNTSLTTRLLYAPALSNTAALPDGAPRVGLSLGANTDAGKWAKFSFGFARAGLGLGSVAADNGLSAGQQTLTLGGQFTPSRQVRAIVNYAQNDLLTSVGGASATSSVALTVTPSAALQVQTNLARNTATNGAATQSETFAVSARPADTVQFQTSLAQTAVDGGGTTQTAHVAVNANPTKTVQLNASFAANNTPGQSADTQAVNVAAVMKPSNVLSLSAGAQQSRLGAATINQQSVSLALTPRPQFQLNTGVALQQNNQYATVVTTVGGTVRPVSFLEFSGLYKTRTAPDADTALQDNLETSKAQVAFSPLKSLKVVGTYAQNPDDQGHGLQHIAQRGLALQTSLGALSLTGGYDWSRACDTSSVGTSLNLGVGVRLSRTMQVTGGYTQALDGIGLLPTGTTAYSLGLTQNLGDLFNLSLSGTMQQNVGSAVTDSPNYTASANLGVKF